ncbi:DUF2842 domain-containing protein [Sneathiella sp.]|uniref:DUF2842 domain-containing protein n=1 Tax=Sneathiella sp. TaxID=1964365 RepID=UPI002FE16483
MTMHARKLIGLVALLLMLALYCGACVFIAVQFLPQNRIVELIFYPVAGVLWIFPAIRIIRWMQAPPEGE